MKRLNASHVSVSVIVPCYNAADTISDCLDSIQKQTEKSLEIICVDCQSVDGTAEILEKLAESDKRIRLIESEVKSYGYQVNIGIKAARGDYIGIVEADDRVAQDMYEVLYKEALNNDKPDVLKADYYETYYDQVEVVKGNSDHGGKEKRIVHIIKDATKYRKKLCMQNAALCLHPDSIATWSGIYRREFLVENEIKHNESPGASFQDIGFWAQTNYYANYVLFLNKPLYRYRIDNESSSTFQTGKRYCLSDELRFVAERLGAYGSFGKEELSDRLAWIFYRKYKRNIERFQEEELKDYYIRFSEDFQLWEKEFGLRYDSFYDEEAEELKKIMNNPSKYYDQLIIRKKTFIKELNEKPKVIIYGAGLIGRTLSMLLTTNIIGYATSNDTENKLLNGIPVRNIDDYKDYARNITLVIASKRSDYRAEMLLKAVNSGFTDIKLLPYGVFEQ